MTKWKGDVPEHTIERGKPHASLEWMDLKDYKSLPQSCDRKAIERLKRML